MSRIDLYEIPLPWPKPPLAQNDRQHHMVKARAFAKAKAEAVAAIQAAVIPPIVGADVTLHYQVPNRIRRDSDGPAPTLKACLDALVAAGVLPDDSWVHVPRSGHEIHPPVKGEPGRVWLELADVHHYDKDHAP